MLPIDVTAAARADLIEILSTSLDRWGQAGQARYESLLGAAFDAVAEEPRRVMSRDCSELAPGLRSFHLRYLGTQHGVKAAVHLVYYRELRTLLEIVRVLHERMDPVGQFLAAATEPGRPATTRTGARTGGTARTARTGGSRRSGR